MKRSIEALANERMTRIEKSGGVAWGPCPVCKAETRSSNDPRGPVVVTESAQSGARVGEPAWQCRVCEAGGGYLSLARALDAEPEAGRESLAVEPEPRASGATINVEKGWLQLSFAQPRWRARFEGWAVGRGFDPTLVDRALRSLDVAVMPPESAWSSLDRHARTLARNIADPPRDLLFALRDPDGGVVDVERRWLPKNRPSGEPKTKRSPGAVVGRNLGTVLFGKLPDAVRAAERDEPIIIVEGSVDYLVAQAACLDRQRGVVLGAPGADDLPKLMTALTTALRSARITPGQANVYVVPDVGDNLHKPDSKGWRIGERKAWAAAIRGLDMARVWWCPPTDAERGDLEDAVLAEADPVSAFWAIIARGALVLDPGPNLGRWQGASDAQIIAAAYRLPLDKMLEFLRWYLDDTGEGGAVYKRGKSIRGTGDTDAETRLAKIVLAWMKRQGIRFLNTPEGLFVWDPIEVARRPPHEPGERRPQPRQLPRLIPIGSRVYWEGWLQEIGWINVATTDGRTINRAIKAAAQRAARSELVSWMTAMGTLREPQIQVHLHTRQEDVLTVRPEVVELRPNGDGQRVLIASDEVEMPLSWVTRIGPTEGARLLLRRLGAHLTVSEPERALIVAWLLLTFVRELVKDRPILWGTGESGSGKSFGASLLNALLYGVAEAGNFTTAALWDLGQREPLLCLDNKEGSFIDDTLLELLLTAATGVKRRKRGGGDRGTIGQRFKGQIHLSAIARPVRDDLQRRTLVVMHDKRFRNEQHRPAEVIADLLRDRSAIWSGVMALFAHRVLPRLATGDHTALADRIGPDHPVEGMREALGVMAVITDALCQEEPAWGPGGAELLDAWLELIDVRVRDIREQADPLGMAMDELLMQWNRLVEDRVTGRTYRPAFTDSLFICKPLFRLAAGRPGRLPYTTERDHAATGPDGVAPVIGFIGTYQMLYRDLVRTPRVGGSLKEALGTPDTIGSRMGNVQGWASQVHRKPKKTPRIYRWICAAADEDAMGLGVEL